MSDYFEYANAVLGGSQPSAQGETIYAPSLAIAYVPRQKFRNLYSAEEGFQKGTIFKELDKPFEGWRMG